MSTTCTECDIEPTTREDGICYGCMLAFKDDGVRGIGESRYDLKPLGQWVPGRNGVQRWVPNAPAAAPPPQARTCELDGCGAKYLPARVNQKYCTKQCRSAADFQRQQARRFGESANTRPQKVA